MKHPAEERLVAYLFHDEEDPQAIASHLQECVECCALRNELQDLLNVVRELPVPERDSTYGEQVWSRLRWRLGREKRRPWIAPVAAAASLILAFLTGHYWTRTERAEAPANTASVPARTPAAPGGSRVASDRVLVLVVSDHLDDAQRMLMTVVNADPARDLDLSGEGTRSGELVASNRLYRQTAEQRGDARIVSLLTDIEPILVEISHADGKLTARQLGALQKRIDQHGLLFKVRLMANQPVGTSPPAATPTSL